MTILDLIKMKESSPKGLKTLWEKEKLLIMSNFSFYLSISKRLVLQTRKNQGLFGKGLNREAAMLEGVVIRNNLSGLHVSCSLLLFRAVCSWSKVNYFIVFNAVFHIISVIQHESVQLSMLLLISF